MTSQQSSRVTDFFYPIRMADGDVQQGSFSLPHQGYLEVLAKKVEEVIKEGRPYNAQSLITTDVLHFCINKISDQHTTCSKKAIQFLTLAQLMMADSRYATDNAFAALTFLQSYVPTISKGITRPATKDDFYRQSDVAGMLVDAMVLLCKHVQQPQAKLHLVNEMIKSFSSALGNFFNPDPDMDEARYWDTRENSAKNFMRVLQDSMISVPEFFKAGRHRILKEMAKDAFFVAARDQDSNQRHALHHLVGQFNSINASVVLNGLGTKLEDPIHLVKDNKGNSLIMIKADDKPLRIVFNYCGETGIKLSFVSADVRQLVNATKTVRTDSSLQPYHALDALLRNFSQPY
jgi:hypothetical protein